MKIYLNLEGPEGKETVDELAPNPGQAITEFYRYVRAMVYEYHRAGINVYRSGRCCNNWKNRA